MCSAVSSSSTMTTTTTFFYFVVFLFFGVASANGQRITTIQLDGVQYFVSRMNPYSPELNYFLAYQYCRSLGLQLASFETREKADSITQYLSNAGYDKYDFWTSGNKLGTEMPLWMSTGLPFNATFNYMRKTADSNANIDTTNTDGAAAAAAITTSGAEEAAASLDVPSGSTSPQRTARESDSSGASNGCVALKAPRFEWDTDDCMSVKDFICEQTRCYYYNYGSIPVSSSQGRPITSTVKPFSSSSSPSSSVVTMTTTTTSSPKTIDDYILGNNNNKLRSISLSQFSSQQQSETKENNYSNKGVDFDKIIASSNGNNPNDDKNDKVSSNVAIDNNDNDDVDSAVEHATNGPYDSFPSNNNNNKGAELLMMLQRDDPSIHHQDNGQHHRNNNKYNHDGDGYVDGGNYDEDGGDYVSTIEPDTSNNNRDDDAVAMETVTIYERSSHRRNSWH